MRHKRTDTPYRLRVSGLSDPSYDPGVIIRAQRFRAQVAGYRLERGHYMDRESDRADRWYIVPLEATEREAKDWRNNGGYTSASGAAEAAITRASGKRGKHDGSTATTDS